MARDLMRIQSGIPGLDEMIEGGFPFPSTILVAGGTGTGKTTLALQFLFEGAKNHEVGLYFTTFSESSQWMLRFASRFTFVNKKYLGKEIKYVELGPLLDSNPDLHNIFDTIIEQITETMPQRIVIDPITVLETLGGKDYRSFLFKLSSRLKNWQAVTLLTGEVLPEEPYPLEAAYTSDGIIILTNIEHEEGRRRYLEVLKLRGTAHMTGKHSVDLSERGFSIQPGLR